MNLFGEIGNFIIKYQEILQAAAIVLAVVVTIWLVVKLFANGRKKREILSQINTTVSEINTAVNHLSEKKTDVIYIDSRMTPGMPGAGGKEGLDVMVEEAASAVGDAVREEGAQPDAVEQDEPSAPEKEVIEPSLKYFSRDCAVSKTGKQFTFEELDAQIRE